MLEDGEITKSKHDKLIKIGKDFDIRANEMSSKWGDYTTNGGENYREILFKMPNSDYRNMAMGAHWDKEGVLAHARVQDMNTQDGKKMLFVEEIQSDWHNAGKKNGYFGLSDSVANNKTYRAYVELVNLTE